MPESAEVQRLLQEIRPAAGRIITRSEVLSGRYKRSPIPGFSQLVGYQLDFLGCKGKLIVMALKHTDNDLAPPVRVLSTLGMTGWWHLSDGDAVLPSQAEQASETYGYSPKHARLRIELDKGALIFTDPRNFGTFKVTSIAGSIKKLEELGPDIAINSGELPPDFLPRFERYGRGKTIAEVMLDQRVFCGVGNYLRADGMYLAAIDPRTPAHDLTRQQLGTLWNRTAMVAAAAYLNKSVSFKRDASFYNVCYGRTTDDHGRPVESYQDRNGRTVWWCPMQQQA